MLWRNGTAKKLENNNVILVKIVERYKNYRDENLAGKMGKTAQFWMEYCKTEDYLSTYLLMIYFYIGQ